MKKYAAAGRFRSGGSLIYLGNGVFTHLGGGRRSQRGVTLAIVGGRVASVSYRIRRDDV